MYFVCQKLYFRLSGEVLLLYNSSIIQQNILKHSQAWVTCFKIDISNIIAMEISHIFFLHIMFSLVGIVLQRNNFTKKIIYHLLHDVASESDITPGNKIDKPIF